MAQRNITSDDIALIIQFARVEHRTGAEFYFLAERDIPEGFEQRLGRLVGTAVIVENSVIKTVYRNRRALASIKRKLKWSHSLRLTKESSHEDRDVTFL
jgi:hypothetical protein